MPVTSVNPVNLSPASPQNPVQSKKDAAETKKTVKTNNSALSKLSVRDGVLVTALPTVIGAGYAAKTYFERKGKFSVYSDLMTKFAENTPEYNNFKDCAKLTKKGMRDAKMCGLLVAAAGIITAGIFAIVKSLKSNDKPADKVQQPTKNSDKKETEKISETAVK